MAVTSISRSLGGFLARESEGMRESLRDLERQLVTGRRAETYSELGANRRLSISFRQTNAQIDAWQETTKMVSMRTNIADLTLGRLSEIRNDAKAAIDPNVFELNGAQTTPQQVTEQLLNEFHALMKSDVGGRYIFGGREVTQLPVAELDTILYGNGVQSGVDQYIMDRKLADQGANGLGRLTVPARVGTTVSFAGEAPATMPFGAKITAISADAPNMLATLTPAAGAVPAAASVDFATQPNIGQKVRVEFELPNGSTNSIVFRADTLIGSDDKSFEIGATPADTAENFRNLLENKLRLMSDSALSSASSLQGAYEFFRTDSGSPPMRVNGASGGGTMATATELMAGTTADTVEWYLGENGPEDPRTGAVSRIDRSQEVKYGMRANEDAFAWMFAKLSAFTLDDYSNGTIEDKERHSRMAEMIAQDFSSRPGNPLVESIHLDIIAAATQVQRAEIRHDTTKNQLSNLIDSIENVTQEEVAVKLLRTQTQLEATYTVTSRLSQMSLVNFLT